MDQTKIGAFLKELRKEKGLTQEQLAEKTGVSSRTVSRWETGSNMPDICLLVELADFYEVDLRELINGERKSEMAMEETRDVLAEVAEYTDAEKKKLMRDVLINSVCTLLGLLLAFGCPAVLNRESALCDFLVHLGAAAAVIFTLSTIRNILKINGSMGKQEDRKIRIILCIGGTVAGILCATIIAAALIA